MTYKKKSAISVCTAIIVLLTAFGSLAIAQVNHKVVGYECIAYLDGHFEDRYLVEDTGTGEVISMRPGELRRLSPAAWDSLIVSQSVAWPEGTKEIGFNMTTLAADYEKDFARALKKYVNKKRGTGNVPKAVLTGDVVDFAAPAIFDPNNSDGMNTLIMTADDRYIPQGVGAFFRVWRSALGGPIKNGYVDTEWRISETDGFFRADLFSMSAFNTYLFIVHEFGHGFGHQHSLFSEDYMSYNPDLVTLKSLKKKNDLSKERDKLYYDKNYQKAARLWSGEVLDLGWGTAPNSNADTLDQNTHHPSFITTLKGYKGAPMTVTFYEGKRASNKKKIVSVSGVTIDYTQQGQGDFLYRFAYRLSLLNIGSSSAYSALQSRLNSNGKAMTINGKKYNKALQITVEIEGRLKEGGSVQTVKKTLILVDTGM